MSNQSTLEPVMLMTDDSNHTYTPEQQLDIHYYQTELKQSYDNSILKGMIIPYKHRNETRLEVVEETMNMYNKLYAANNSIDFRNISLSMLSVGFILITLILLVYDK